MSLLKRIESARPGAGPAAGPGVPAPTGPGAPTPPTGGQPPAAPSRLMSQGPVRESFRDVKFRIQSRVIQDLDPKLDLSNQVEVRRQIEEIFGKVIDEEGLALTRAERVRMLEQITDEIIGLGPLEPLLRDESITEVMVNGPRQVYIERNGRVSGLEIEKVSGHPPMDFAARDAILDASPLPPLPADLTGVERERVTITFFYNTKPPDNGK